MNFWMLKTATMVGRGHHTGTLLILLASSFHSPTFWKRSFTTLCYSSCFHVGSCPLMYSLSTISKRHRYRRTTSPLNKQLLGNLRTNRERVILPSLQSKIKKKNTPFIDQSACSNFALYVISTGNYVKSLFFCPVKRGACYVATRVLLFPVSLLIF